MRAGPGDYVRACVDGGVREGLEELGRDASIMILLVCVEAYDHVVGEHSRILDRSHNPLNIRFERPLFDAKVISDGKHIAHERKFLALLPERELQTGRQAAELFESRLIDEVVGGKAQGAQPWPPPEVGALRSGRRVNREG